MGCFTKTKDPYLPIARLKEQNHSFPKYKGKYKHSHPGFELKLPIPFPTIITIILSVTTLNTQLYIHFVKDPQFITLISIFLNFHHISQFFISDKVLCGLKENWIFS